jgi:hypothetical protein
MTNDTNALSRFATSRPADYDDKYSTDVTKHETETSRAAEACVGTTRSLHIRAASLSQVIPSPVRIAVPSMCPLSFICIPAITCLASPLPRPVAAAAAYR